MELQAYEELNHSKARNSAELFTNTPFVIFFKKPILLNAYACNILIEREHCTSKIVKPINIIVDRFVKALAKRILHFAMDL